MKKNLYFNLNLFYLVFFCLILFNWYSCTAQYSPWESFSTAHGLGDIEVYTIYESPTTGNLWFGTRNGATRYDGTWRNFNLDNKNSAGNRVYAIEQDNFGSIWFGTQNGIKIFHNGQIKPAKFNSSINTSIWIIKRDKFGRMWLGTSNCAYYYNPNDSTINPVYMNDDQFSNIKIKDIEFDISENVWFGTSGDYIYRLNIDGDWTHFNDLNSSQITDLFYDKNNTLLASTNGERAYSFNGTNWVPFLHDNPYKYIMAIAQDWDGDYWFATLEHGVARFDSVTELQNFTIENGLTNNDVLDIMEDSYRNIWVATRLGGVSRYNGSWQTFFKVHTGKDYVYAMEKDENENILIGTNGNGIYIYNGTTLNHVPSQEKILSVLKSSDSTIWLGTRGNGIKKWNNAKLDDYDSLFDNKSILSIAEDSRGDLWFGSETGGAAKHCRNQSSEPWKIFTIDSGLTNNTINDIYEDHKGLIWFATNYGISMLDSTKFKKITKDTIEIIPSTITSIAEDNDGILYFGSYSGIVEYDRLNWNLIKTEDGLSSNRIFSVLFDPYDEKLWAGTDRGVNYLSVDNASENNWRFLSPQITGLPDRYILSMLLDRTTDLSPNDTSSALWFGTKGGVTRYLGAAFPPNTFISTSNDTIFGTSNPVFKVYARDNISESHQIAYSYKWINLDDKSSIEWTEYLIGDKITVLENLDNGSFEIHIRAMDEDGNVDPTPAKMGFQINNNPPKVIIHSPQENQKVAGRVEIIGMIVDDDLAKYEIEYKNKESQEWNSNGITYISSNNISEDTLTISAMWNLSNLDDQFARYNIRLLAIDSLGHEANDEKNVILDQLYTKKNIGESGDSIITSFNDKYIKLYIPPNSIDKIVNVEMFSLDKDSVNFNFSFISCPWLFEISATYENTNKMLKLKKYGILSIKDPIFVGDFNKYILYHRPSANASEWKRIGGTIENDQGILKAPLKSFGEFAVIDTIMFEPESNSFDCQPRVFSLKNNNLPNHTTIFFSLDELTPIQIKIFNIGGRMVRKLEFHDNLSIGENAVSWDGQDNDGNNCVSGLYIICLLKEGRKKIKTVAIINN